MGHRKLTREQLIAELTEAHGSDPRGWAFTCPNCNTVTTGQAMKEALKAHPRTNRAGEPVITSDVIGQECIGRIDPEQGCNWAAFGLFRGPWELDIGDGKTMWCFPIAPTTKEGPSS